MKKLLLTLLSINLLFACQSPPTKKIDDVKIMPETQEIDANQLVDSLDECYKIDRCREDLNKQFNSWLVDKNYIATDEPVSTDEDDGEIVTKIVRTANQQEVNKITLSSVYMNNQLIKGAINEWLTWKRPQLINTWHYFQYLREDMLPAFEKYGIEESLILGIMAQESGGKVHSRSRAGAGGLFQIMPATAKRLGLSGKDGAYDLRFNPKQSAFAAAKYIDEQWKLYDGDEAKLLAAYNSGENRFARLNKKYKNRSLWDKNFYYELPRETRHYIPVVIAAMLIFQDPEKFNVVLDKIDTETQVVQIAKKSSLSELAVCLGQQYRVDGWFRVLRNLNSGIKADASIEANTALKIPKILSQTFEEKCSDTDLMSLAQSFHEADFQATKGMFKYKVKSGDSLSAIVRKFRCTSKKEIASLNNLRAPRYLIRAGKYLNIPQC
ncbi:MAG: transglycosylase SLT domain-containing protein [Marinicellaceae bacterium]